MGIPVHALSGIIRWTYQVFFWALQGGLSSELWLLLLGLATSPELW